MKDSDNELDKNLALCVGAVAIVILIATGAGTYGGVTKEHHIQEMAKLGYCQKQILGSESLIWQKCDNNESK